MDKRKFFKKLEDIPNKQEIAYQTIIGNTKSYDDEGNLIGIHPQYVWTWDLSPEEAPDLWEESRLDE